MMLKLQGAGHELPVGDLDEDDEKTRELISQEEEAANQYEMMADDADSDDAKHIFNDIADEEKTHAGELFLLLLQEDPSDGKKLKEGMEEASEELSGEGEGEDDSKSQDSADLDTMKGLMDTSFRDLFQMGREKVLDKANGKDSVEKSALAYRRRSDIESKDAPRGEWQMDPYDGIPPEQIANTERRLAGILHNFPNIAGDDTIPDVEKPKRLAAHLQTVTGMPVRKVLKVFDYNRKNNNEMIRELLNRHLDAETPGVSNVFDLQTYVLGKYPDTDYKDAFRREYDIPEQELARYREHRESNKDRTGHLTDPRHKVGNLKPSLDKTMTDTISRVDPEVRAEEKDMQKLLDRTGVVVPTENYGRKMINVGADKTFTVVSSPKSSESPKKVIEEALNEEPAPVVSDPVDPVAKQKHKMDARARRDRKASRAVLASLQGMDDPVQETAPPAEAAGAVAGGTEPKEEEK